MRKVYGLPIWVWIVIALVLCGSIVIGSCGSNKKDHFSNQAPVPEPVESSSQSSDAGNKIKVMNFNTEWCGYSKQFQGAWDEFSSQANQMAGVEAVDVKCDQDENKQMCKEYEIPGYPSVIFEKNGERIEYEGLRSVDGLMSKLQELL